MEREDLAHVPDKYGRFKGADWFELEKREVLVGGAGGIGSWLTLFLTRANFKCFVFDFDRVETHNMGGQLYGKDAVGNLKVAELSKIVSSLSGDRIVMFNEKYNKDSPSNWATFSCFDNMEARKDMFENWVRMLPIHKTEGHSPIFIDGRLRAEQMQIFCVTENTIEEYRKHLFSSAEVEPDACTMKQTSHSAAMIASHMMAFFTNHLVGEARELPFYWSYFIPLNLLTEEPPVYDTDERKG